MMKLRADNETLTFLAMTVFFGLGLLLSREFISVSSAWDYIVIQVLTMMNGLGLGIVLILWVGRLLTGKTAAREEDGDDTLKQIGE